MSLELRFMASRATVLCMHTPILTCSHCTPGLRRGPGELRRDAQVVTGWGTESCCQITTHNFTFALLDAKANADHDGSEQHLPTLTLRPTLTPLS